MARAACGTMVPVRVMDEGSGRRVSTTTVRYRGWIRNGIIGRGMARAMVRDRCPAMP